jgi:DHA1 family bicyclomycin/chloramphenicol resistance-like MFS transporter
MFGFMLFAGMCGPCLGVLALSDHATEAGTAAAVLGAVNFGMAGVASPIVGMIGIASFAPLGVVMGSCMALAALLLWVLVWDRTEPATA